MIVISFRNWISVSLLRVLFIMIALITGIGASLPIDYKGLVAKENKQILYGTPRTSLSLCGLSYAEGGPVTKDPGQNITHKFYIDSQKGIDDAPGTKETPWKTLAKVKQHMEDNSEPGTHYLLKRGSIWTESLDVTGVHGASDGRIVMGAYGSLSDSSPKISGELKFSDSSYLMVCDLEVAGAKNESGAVTTNGAIAFRQDAHNSIIYNNSVHTAESNIIKLYKGVHHMVIAQNFVYDTRINDGISLHQVKWGDDSGDLGNHHWIIDNTVIGNSGMEEPIDVASSAAEDIKIVDGSVK